MIHYGLLLFFVLEYIRPTTFFPFLTPLRLYTIVPIVIAIYSLFKGKVPSGDAAKEPTTLTIATLLGLIVLSVLTAIVTEYSFTKFETVFGYGLIYWVIIRQVDELEKLKDLFKVLTLVHVVLAILSPDMLLNAEGRGYLISGTFLADGNDFALSLNIALPLCVFLYLDAKKWWRKAFFLGLLVFLLICIVATKSRGGTIALACIGLYYWTKSAQKLRATIVVVLAIGVVLAIAPPAYISRMNTIGDTEESSAKGRIDSWKAAIGYATDSPLLGIGAGHFNAIHGLTAHSIYFLILGELGFPGIIVLLYFILYNLWANRRLMAAIKRDGAVDRTQDSRLLVSTSAALIAYASGGAFLSAVYYPHLFVIGGLMVAARRIVRERVVAEQSEKTNAGKPAITLHWALQPRRKAPQIA